MLIFFVSRTFSQVFRKFVIRLPQCLINLLTYLLTYLQ